MRGSLFAVVLPVSAPIDAHGTLAETGRDRAVAPVARRTATRHVEP